MPQGKVWKNKKIRYPGGAGLGRKVVIAVGDFLRVFAAQAHEAADDLVAVFF